MIGRLLAHFRIVAKLGEGGMGVVYRATDERLRRDVALKVLQASLAQNPERQRRFLREARAAAAVTHGNIATVHDIGEADGHVFIAMELVEGDTLRARMQPGLTHVEALRITKEIAKGLARAHESGVVHRDLKPENVMVTKDGDVKILDFGLAKLVDVDAGPATDSSVPTGATESQVTAEGRVMGTPPYMSPEQVEGRAELDVRSDVFSLGVMLYEMIAGVRPFQGKSSVAVMFSVLHRDPEPLEVVSPGAPLVAVEVVARCLKKPVDERYASGREVLAALEAAVPTMTSAGATEAAMSAKATPSAKITTISGMGTALEATRVSDTLDVASAALTVKRRRFRGLAALAAALVAAGAVIAAQREHGDASRRALASVTSAAPSVSAAASAPDTSVSRANGHDGSAAPSEHALATDATFVATLAEKAGLSLEALDARDAPESDGTARDLLAHCSVASPPDAACIYLRAQVENVDGSCAKAAADLRKVLELIPAARDVRAPLAGVLAAEGASVTAVQEALGPKTPADARDGRVPLDVLVPTYEGDFVEVERLAKGALAAVPAGAPELAQSTVVATLVEAYSESDDTVSAGAIAADTLARRAVRAAPTGGWLGVMIGAAARGGRLDRTEASRHLDAAYASIFDAKTDPSMTRGAASTTAWAMTYASASETAAEAAVAVAKLDALGGQPLASWSPAAARTLFLAGRGEAARASFEKTVQVCSNTLLATRSWNRAHLYLGELDELRGERASACAHYAKVVERWGHATPRSVTADDARTHAKALGCEK